MNATRRRITGKPLGRKKTPVALVPDPRLVRLSRVRIALERIQSGFYDRDEVRDRLAAAVLEELQKL